MERLSASPANSHCSCSAPSMVRAGSNVSGHGGSSESLTSPQAWSVRCWRPSRRNNVPSGPSVNCRRISYSAPSGGGRRTGWCSHQAWYAAARRSRNASGATPVLAGVAGVVVLDLVVVPDHEPRRRRVRGLQVGVAAVERVPVAVAGQLGRLGAVVAADDGALALADGSGRSFVDVVAQPDEGVELGCCDVPVRGVEAGLVVLTGGVTEGQRGVGVVARTASSGCVPRGWCRARPRSGTSRRSPAPVLWRRRARCGRGRDRPWPSPTPRRR